MGPVDDIDSAKTILVDIGLFAVFGDIEAAGLNFGISSQAEKCSQNQSNNRAPDDRQDNRDNDGFHLRNKECAQQLIGEIAIRFAGCEKTGEQCAECSSHRMYPKGIQRVIVVERWLYDRNGG